MSISAGRLRHRILLQSRQESVDPDTGARSYTWIDIASVWAAIEPMSAREFFAAAAAQSKVTTRIVIRYRAGVNADMRAIHNGAIYNIEGVLADKDSGLEYLTLLCSEGVNDG